jgi:membrane-associated phospholipid phosphatase
MHVAFALMIAIPAIILMKRRVLKLVWAAYPPAVAFVVVVTANHWWIDGAIGVLVAALSACGAYAALARVRPEAWSWRRAPARITA